LLIRFSIKTFFAGVYPPFPADCIEPLCEHKPISRDSLDCSAFQQYMRIIRLGISTFSLTFGNLCSQPIFLSSDFSHTSARATLFICRLCTNQHSRHSAHNFSSQG
jgi:hypothetical protein